MGTTYQLKVVGTKIEASDLKKDVDRLLEGINLKMSTYIPRSELSRFNSNTSTDWLPLSKELATVLETARQVNKQSGGAFDVTVGPLVNLWGFGPDKRPDSRPQAAAIAAAKEQCGMNLLELDPPNLRARKQHPALYIDLSAIAKGYGVDQVAKLLVNKGIENFLVEIGGEIRAGGVKESGEKWTIAIERAENSSQQAQRLLAFTDLALATSGSYRNYFEENGVRYSHTIDPSSGLPISHTLVSVSVASTNCMTADAWATALMVLGPEKGREVAERHKLAALFIEKKGTSFTEKASSQWNSLLP